MYGRVSQAKCRYHNFREDKCMSNISDTVNKIKEICDTKNVCKFEVNETLFDNPCRGIYKYLDVKYECV